MNFFQKILFLPDYLNGYGMGDPNRNGEYRFLRKYIKNNMIVFDVGAHLGEYAAYLLETSDNLEIHAFEPVTETFNELKNRTFKKKNSEVFFNNFGLSDIQEEKEINIYGQFSGLNSLHLMPKSNARKAKERIKIQLETLDSYVTKMEIDIIDLLKIDVEGHELKVLEGAKNSFKNGIVKCIQFEYGKSFLNSGSKLGNVFSLLKKYNFTLARITPYKLRKIKDFSPELENYKHSNWIAKLSESN